MCDIISNNLRVFNAFNGSIPTRASKLPAGNFFRLLHRKFCVIPLRLIASALLILASPRIGFSQSEMQLRFSSANRFVTAHGRQAWAGGYANRGLEIWAGALQIANEVRPEFRREGGTTSFTAGQTLANVAVLPGYLSRTYTGPDFAVREEIRVPQDQSAVLIQYTVQSPSPVQVIVKFCPSLNLMWPAAVGGQSVRWDKEISAYILTEPTRQVAALALAPGATLHDEPLNNAAAQARELAVALDPARPQVLFAKLTNPSADAAELSALKELFTSSLDDKKFHAQSELSPSDVQIETPDPDLNRALSWAEIDLDQAWVCNELLGCGFVAGFGPSRRSRRPQYAWYFAGDGMIAARAAMDIGDLEHARNELKFISKYQRSDGMIWHEISQSAPYLDWQNKYPYMFVHADLTYPYISSVAGYIRRSSDRAYLHEAWPSVQKAFEYGKSLVSGDGLPRIPPKQLGADEQSSLTDELGLSASWILSCEDYAFLSELMGDKEANAMGTKLASVARASFPHRYWSVQQNSPIHGYTRAGSPVPDAGLQAIEAVKTHLFSGTQARWMLDQLSTWQFQSDWGTRSLPVGDANYDPTGYVHGSVSALHSVTVAEAFWEQHRPESAFEIWHDLLPWFWLDSPGHMHEVLQGNVYMPQSESVPEQTWSSAGFLTGAIEGLFGLEVNAESNQVTLAPHLPADWGHASIGNVPVGRAMLTFSFEQTLGELTVRIENTGQAVQLLYSPEIALGARNLRATLGEKSLSARITSHEQDSHAELQVDVPHGTSQIRLHYQDGISLALPHSHPRIGEPSSEMKITSVTLVGNVLHLGIDFLPGSKNNFGIRTRRAIETITNASFTTLSDDSYMLSIPSNGEQSRHEYQHAEIEINLASSRIHHASTFSVQHVGTRQR